MKVVRTAANNQHIGRLGEVLDSNNHIADSSYTDVSHGGVGGEGGEAYAQVYGMIEMKDEWLGIGTYLLKVRRREVRVLCVFKNIRSGMRGLVVYKVLYRTGGYRGLRSVKNRSPATMVHWCRSARWVTYSVSFFAEHWRRRGRDSILLPFYPSPKPDRTRQEEIVMIHSGATEFLSID
ncbi:hypothetical protein K440DRAFT_263912 [Wilcoxina mikolae CBS 423.85]|nr:hypothetical protein K440DRAFT_263912 [Wilcoxina mikolae CBS 423.85]